MNEYKDRKITRTSFLDDAFRKNLESALRFGNPLLVQVCPADIILSIFIQHLYIKRIFYFCSEGCRKLRPHPKPSAEQRGQKDWRACPHHSGRPGH